jgi:hypothetical protein
MNIQSIQKTMAQIGHGILTALFNGLAAFGCGMVGLPYEIPRDNNRIEND